MNPNHSGNSVELPRLSAMTSLFRIRTRLLHDVYSILADLIDWSDQLLLAENKSAKPDERYKTIAEDLIQAIQVSRRKGDSG